MTRLLITAYLAIAIWFVAKPTHVSGKHGCGVIKDRWHDLHFTYQGAYLVSVESEDGHHIVRCNFVDWNKSQVGDSICGELVKVGRWRR